MDKFQKYYGKVFKLLLNTINPFKKILIKTECKVHKFNNIQSVNLLKKFNYQKEYLLFKKYLKYLNYGSVWADQDFKSTNHFYNPNKKRGLFGHNNSMNLSEDYYKKSVNFWQNDKELSMFYLGACVHIIQDLTIPQHVSIHLLNKHRQYENFVKYTYDLINEYKANESPIILNTPNEYVDYNSKATIKLAKRYKNIKDDKIRFYKQTLYSLPLAQRTTAGCFLLFLKDINTLKKTYSINK